MKREIALAMCAALLVLVSPAWSRAQQHETADNVASTTNNQMAHQEALKMVPDHAKLLEKIDAKDVHAGQQIEAQLDRTVQLKDGRELPKDTMLLGTVTEDRTQPLDLALRFNSAKLHNGSTIPVKVMIVSIQPPSPLASGVTTNAPVTTADIWTPGTDRIDAPKAISGADFHSNIASNNSGTISSAKKTNVTIDKGSRIDLVIGSQQNSARG